MGEGFEKALQGLRQHFLPPTPTIFVFSDYEKE